MPVHADRSLQQLKFERYQSSKIQRFEELISSLAVKPCPACNATRYKRAANWHWHMHRCRSILVHRLKHYDRLL